MSELAKSGWDDSLSIGYNNIDIQHKKLFTITGRFQEALKMPSNEYKVKIGKILTNLIDYTVYHFSAEEKVMEKYAYPDLAEHIQIHKAFIQKVNSNLKQIASGDIATGKEFHDFLTKWLIEHIAVTDRKWAEYIHANFPEEEF